jgi:hypothetical protein
MMHRKLHVDTLISILTFKIYVFSYSRQTDKQTDREINLEELSRLPSPHRINFSICLSVCPSVCLSVIYENTLNFHVVIKIKVSTWSFLSVVHPLQIPIPMYEKKIWVQQENS